ncbi:MAG TPA: DUF6454 family protein [Kofleriaceae bacterium]|nr:DUF6454 family protein [Kofleriaceae bacterium]
MTGTRALALLMLLGGCVRGADDPEGSQPAGSQIDSSQEELSHTRRRDDDTTDLFRLLGRNAIWTQLSAVEMQGWTTFHTQGLVKIGDAFFVSSVEVLEPTVPNGTQTDALYDFSIDRSVGVGRGWLSKFSADGHLLGQVELTHGSIYHPGGIDFDGESLWVPVAEYRPNSHSEIYRVDPDTLEAELAFRVDDHIGGIVHNRHGGTLNGVSWGSRRLYTFEPHGRGHGHGEPRDPESSWTPNGDSTIDYQDCHYHGVEYMLCGGVASYATPSGPIAFGGLDLVDLRSARAIQQVPVNQFIDEGSGPNPGLALAHNAFWAEPLDDRSLRIYFMTETDNQAALLVYRATPWVNR